MTSVSEIGQAIKSVLGVVADKAAREVGFTKRESKMTGSKFVQTIVLGWLKRPDARLEELSQSAASVGLEISAQGIDQRFTREAADLLQHVLDAALGQVIAADPVAIPVLRRFGGVVVQDSSIISLPDDLADVWKGCGGSNGHLTAALKVQVRFDVLTGTLTGPMLETGRTSDRGSVLQSAPLPAKSLRIADLGYFSVDQLGQIDAQDAYFLTRFHLQTALFDIEGNRMQLSSILATAPTGQIDRRVLVGAERKLPVRFLAVRVPDEVAEQRRRKVTAEARHKGGAPSQVRLRFADWNILITNVSEETLSLHEAMTLVRVRWQIELLFKLWKSHGKIDEWRTKKPSRILCETYAKLIAMIVQHWLLLVGCWAYSNRSLVKAAQTIRDYVPMLECALAGYVDIVLPIEQVQRCLAAGCRLNSRRKCPGTAQLLLGLGATA